MGAAGRFREDGAIQLRRAGLLIAAEGAGLRHGGVDEGELLSARTDRRKVGDVFDAKSIGGFERSQKAGDFLFHDVIFPDQLESLPITTGSEAIIQNRRTDSIFFCHRDTEFTEKVLSSVFSASLWQESVRELRENGCNCRLLIT